MNKLLTNVLWILLVVVSIPSVLAQENDWPHTLPLEQGMVTIYSLQVDKMSDDIIHYRAALAYRATAGSEPVFGAGWFESPVVIDSSNRIVHPTDLKVTDTRFPAGTDDVQSELTSVLAQQSPTWNLDFSLDELEADLKTAEQESIAIQNMNTAPPEIIYRDHPALLISMDGDPVLREIENSPLEAVINTPYPLIFDRKHYYLNAAKDVWYRADKATGPYRFTSKPPKDIATMVEAADSGADNTLENERITAANAPEIVVSTKPAELIVTEGPAAFVPLVEDLLVLQNSDDDVFMHVSSQEFYIVRAGRWYRASSLEGPWNYQPADGLPTAFANIPQDSNQADSRVYVAGTEEANEAVLDAQIPQTAAVKRGEADIEVEYDGEPVYASVDGTGLVYIQNTGSTVIQSDGLYYLVENGVWYVSSSPSGPWQVSDHRPEQVDTILPTSPVYNVKYVRVYDSTPEVVYVGYTPGYTGSYIYRNTLVYGTGWYYRPWVSPYYYYPRHSTWGLNVSYNSWSGWNFGLSWGWGPFSVGWYSGGYWHRNQYWHHRHYGHWGPRGYRPRPVHYRHGGNRYSHNGYKRGNRGGRDHDRYSNGDHRSNRNERHDNLYRDQSQRARVSDTRDNKPRATDRRNKPSRQTKYVSASNGRQKNYMGLKKGERNKTGRVSSSDLRKKADVRDVNSRANRSKMLADNDGKVYRKKDRNSNPYAPVRRDSLLAKNTKQRGDQTPRNGRNNTKNARQGFERNNDRATANNRSRSANRSTDRSASQQRQSRTVNNQSRRQASVTTSRPAPQMQEKTRNNGKRRTSPVTTTPSQRSQPKVRNNTGRKPSTAARTPARQSQAKTRSNRSTPTVRAPNRQSQAKTSSNRVRQQALRTTSAPKQKQSQPQARSKARNPSNGDRKNSTSANRSAQKSAPKSSQQRSSLKSSQGNGRRGGGRR